MRINNTPLNKLLVLYALLLFALSNYAQTVTLKNDSVQENIGKHFSIYDDTDSKLTINDIFKIDTAFKISENAIPNFYVSSHTHWLKSRIINLESDSNYVIQIKQPSIDFVDFFITKNHSILLDATSGDRRLYQEKTFPHTTHIAEFKIPQGDSIDMYIRVKGGEHVQVPINIGSANAMNSRLTSFDLIAGIYIGIILVMILYNLFVFMAVRDKSYLYYVFYILIVGFTQINFQGYAARIFWPNNEWLLTYAVYFLSSFVAIASMEFMKVFLHTNVNYPSFTKVIRVFYSIYAIAIIAALCNYFTIAYMTIQFNASIAATYLLVCAIRIMNTGYRPAKYFVYAWSIFLIGVVVYVSKDYGILPFNDYTVYLMPLGTAVEVVLLSFALADRINVLKKEKEISQAEALRVSQENERIVREQNVVLEEKVSIRTKELSKTNIELSKTLEELKQTQSQLVEQEKMASLGQLTAGVAHEINNPINFVLANVKPIKRDIGILIKMIDTVETIALSDLSKEVKIEKITELKNEIDFDYLKTEIDFLLKGIDEGSSRTAEIVKGLRVFSRLDEDDAKLADINEGINSTIVICNNLLGTKIQIEKNYTENGMIECYHGKMNQVFMNMMTNAIYAVKDRYKDNHGGFIKITTERINTNFIITFEDNGNGMNEATQQRLFEPFFTTKPVGDGTGLGLSISFNIIKKHNGSISVESSENEGTKFIIEIPVSLLKN